MKSLLIHVRPMRFPAGTRVDVRIGSAADAAALGLGGFKWDSAVVRRPRISLVTIDENLSGKLQTARGDVIIALESIISTPDSDALYWDGAPIVIYDADGLDLATAPVEFHGVVRSTSPDLETGHLTLTLDVAQTRLKRPLLGASFDGDGEAGGQPEKRGVPKPAGFGQVRDAEIVWIDEIDNIGMLDGYGNLLSVQEFFEGANSLGAPIADYPTFAALKAAVASGAIPDGRLATCVAEGFVAAGAPPAGVITADATFGINRAGAFIRRLLSYHASIPLEEIDTAALAALDVEIPHATHYWTRNQRDVLDLVEAVARSINATPLLLPDGRFSIARPFNGDVIGELNRFGTSTPRVTDWATADPEPPTWRMTARADRPGRVLSPDEVFYEDELKDRGLYDPTETYRQGHQVWLRDGSQWLWINPEPGSGRAPPAPPATENDDWFRIKPPTTASDLLYEDGTPIEDLKPAAPGATRNEHKGAWAAGVSYEPGDVVEYIGSSYQVITAHVSSAGDPPPNANVELLAAKGETAPVLLVQWSVDGVSGWHPTFEPNDQYLRTSNDGGLTWSPAAKVVGEGGGTGNSKQFVFRRAASQPATPVGNGIPSGWSDAPPAANGQPLWMSVALQNSSGVTLSSWSAPVQLDSPRLLVQWSVDGVSGWHPDFAPGDLYIRTSSDGGVTWSTAARVVGEGGGAGTPGPTGNFKQYVFRRAAAQPATPTGNGIPSGWSDGPPVGTDFLWMSVAEQTSTGVLVNSWSTPVRITGDPGQDGIDGVDGIDGRSLSPASAIITVAATFDGAVKGSSLPKTLQFIFLSGSTDVTGSTAWVIDQISADGTAASINSSGLLTITAVGSGSSAIVVKGTYSGTAIQARVTFALNRDAAPPPAATSQTAFISYNTNSLSYDASPVRLFTLQANGSGGLSASLNVVYSAAGGTWAAAAKFAYRLAGSGAAWVQFGSEQLGTVANSDIPPGEPGSPEGSISVTGVALSGLVANGAYEVAVFIRKRTGTGTLDGDLQGWFTVTQ